VTFVIRYCTLFYIVLY